MQMFTDIKMLYCYLVLQDWSVSIEKPFVLCRCVIFFSLLSHGLKRSTENTFQGTALLNLSLIWLIAVFLLLPSRYVNAAVWTAAVAVASDAWKDVFLPRSSPFWLAWWEGGSTVCDEEDTLRPWSVVISPPAPPPSPSVFTLGSAEPREESWSS